MTMRYVLKMYPNGEQETNLALEVLAKLKGVVDGRAGYVSNADALDTTETIHYGGDIPDASARVVKVDGWTHFNEQHPPMDFGGALAALKSGKKVARAGWNGKGMWACLQKGYPDGIAINKNTAEATGLPEGTVCKFRPYLLLYSAQGDFAHWNPSGSDLLSEDWYIVA